MLNLKVKPIRLFSPQNRARGSNVRRGLTVVHGGKKYNLQKTNEEIKQKVMDKMGVENMEG